MRKDDDMTVKQVWQYGKMAAIVPIIATIITNGRYGKVVEIDYSTKKVFFEGTITAGKPWFNIVTFRRTE